MARVCPLLRKMNLPKTGFCSNVSRHILVRSAIRSSTVAVIPVTEEDEEDDDEDFVGKIKRGLLCIISPFGFVSVLINFVT